MKKSIILPCDEDGETDFFRIENFEHTLCDFWLNQASYYVTSKSYELKHNYEDIYEIRDYIAEELKYNECELDDPEIALDLINFYIKKLTTKGNS